MRQDMGELYLKFKTGLVIQVYNMIMFNPNPTKRMRIMISISFYDAWRHDIEWSTGITLAKVFNFNLLIRGVNF